MKLWWFSYRPIKEIGLTKISFIYAYFIAISPALSIHRVNLARFVDNHFSDSLISWSKAFSPFSAVSISIPPKSSSSAFLYSVSFKDNPINLTFRKIGKRSLYDSILTLLNTMFSFLVSIPTAFPDSPHILLWFHRLLRNAYSRERRFPRQR